MLRTVGEAVAHVRARPVLEFANAAGSAAVCNESLGLFVMVVLCITDGVAVVVTAIIFCAVVCDAEEDDSVERVEARNCKAIAVMEKERADLLYHDKDRSEVRSERES